MASYASHRRPSFVDACRPSPLQIPNQLTPRLLPFHSKQINIRHLCLLNFHSSLTRGVFSFLDLVRRINPLSSSSEGYRFWFLSRIFIVFSFEILFLTLMAQKTGKEETEFKVVPETICLCVKCGVAGNFAANSLCQKCFSATTAASTSSAAAAVPSATSASGAEPVLVEKSFRSGTYARASPERVINSAQTRRDLRDVAPAPVPMKREVNRCLCCRRRVGLTGFRCRCGELFCAEHRYSDRHNCSYDYKTAGREAIAKENPVVKAAKIVKI